MKRTAHTGELNRRYLTTLIVSGAIRPIFRTRRAPMTYSRRRFTVICLLTLAALLITIALGRLGVI